jgi:AAA domain
LYICREPGQGGEAFVAGIRQRLRAIGWRGQAVVFSCNSAKDPNELQQQHPQDFQATFQAILDRAEPLTPALRTYTAAELMKMDLPEPRMAVPDLIAEGVTILAGRPKIGKSWLTLSLSMAVASGGKALGTKSVEQGEVLYAALEDNPRRMQSRIDALLEEGESAPRGLHIVHRLPRMREGLAEALTEWLDLHPQARLIVIDTLARIRPPRQPHRDWYAEDMAWGEELNQLALAHHVAIVVVHHLNKGGAADPLDQVHGTMGVTGSAEGIVISERSRGQADATLLVTGRDVEEQRLALQFDGGVWRILGQAEEYALSQQRQDIRALLRQADGPMTPKAIVRSWYLATIRRKLGHWCHWPKSLRTGRAYSPSI